MKYIEKNLVTNNLVIEAQSLLDLSKRYNENDRVREIIRIIYSGCCAFCECSPEDGSFFQIEHFYPKSNSKFRKFKMRIENLHYSCQRCNNLKGKLVNLNIFSANYFLTNHLMWAISSTAKIESEIFYIGHLLFSKNKVALSIDRGQETINLFDLNNFNGANRSRRLFLVESRLRVFATVQKIITAIFELISNYTPNNNKAIEILFLIAIKYTNNNTHYSTMTIHNFGADIYKLLSIHAHQRR